MDGHKIVIQRCEGNFHWYILPLGADLSQFEWQGCSPTLRKALKAARAEANYNDLTIYSMYMER